MTNHFTQEEAVTLAKQSQGPKSNGVITAHWLDMDFAALTRLCNAAVDAKLAKVEARMRGEEINGNVLLQAIARGWCSEKNSSKIMDPILALAIRDEVQKLFTHPQASEPAPSTAVERACHTCKHSDSWGLPDCVMPGSCGSTKSHWEPLNQPKADRIKPTKIKPGSSAYFAMLGAEFGYNFLVGDEFHQMQAYSKKVWVAALLEAQPKLEPLTEEQIDAAVEAWFGAEVEAKGFKTRMRLAIEAAHKIGGQE